MKNILCNCMIITYYYYYINSIEVDQILTTDPMLCGSFVNIIIICTRASARHVWRTLSFDHRDPAPSRPAYYVRSGVQL